MGEPTSKSRRPLLRPIHLPLNLEVDYQLHQIRFLLAFIMTTIGVIALNFDWRVEETFTTVAWIQFYFLISGVSRQWRTMGEDNLVSILIYTATLLLIL